MDEALNLPGAQSLRAAAELLESPTAIPPFELEVSRHSTNGTGPLSGEPSVEGQACDVAIPLIYRLGVALRERRVTYCHWKSNWRINRWMRGEGDLDLLVKRSDAE